MPKILRIGPPTDHVGKSLWEILGNLKNFGVGRYVKRNIYERYQEPTYFRILKVETLSMPKDKNDLRNVRAYTEKVFRGRKYEKIFEICHESWKPDYVLVPKSEENSLIAKAEAVGVNLKEKVLPQTLPFPPLLKEFIIQERFFKGLPSSEEPRLKLVVKEGDDALYRIAKDGEKPTTEFGVPLSPHLYEVPELFKEILEKEGTNIQLNHVKKLFVKA